MRMSNAGTEHRCAPKMQNLESITESMRIGHADTEGTQYVPQTAVTTHARLTVRGAKLKVQETVTRPCDCSAASSCMSSGRSDAGRLAGSNVSCC